MSQGPRLRDGLRYCTIVFLGLRTAMFVIAFTASGLVPVRPGTPAVPGWPSPPVVGGWHGLFSAFERQDAIWFLRIATHGYARGDGSAAFFPLYPIATRIASFLGGGRPLLGATLVSNAAFFGALVVLYALTTLEFSQAHARRTVLYLAVFPTSFFFLAPYSESLFLLLAVSTFWFARRDRWALAAMMAVLAAMTRSIGIVLAPALLVEGIYQWREHGSPLWPRIAAAAAVALGPISNFLYWQVRFHDYSIPYEIQKQWQRTPTLSLTTLGNAVVQAYRYQSYWAIDLLVTAVVLVAAAIGVWRLRPAYSVFAWLSLAIPLSYPLHDRALLSMPRFCVVVFPAFWVLADLVERKRLPHTAVVATFAGGLGLLSVLFINWWHIF
jgi:hypothetical protein